MVTGNPYDYEMTDAVRRGVDPRVFTTNPGDPEEGLTFVWAMTRWHERVEGPMGEVGFSPLEEGEAGLRQRLAAEGLDLTKVDNDFARTVRDEFMEQPILYPDAPEYSDQSQASDEEDEPDPERQGGTRF